MNAVQLLEGSAMTLKDEGTIGDIQYFYVSDV
jgi:hypothetical protein